jgi:peptidoglycan/LPS O-acetylase OafA/YrhL
MNRTTLNPPLRPSGNTRPIGGTRNSAKETETTPMGALAVSQFTQRSIAAAERPSRIPALDFTKGALVLIMVLYHWLNYFVSSDGFGYRYLRFLTPSFIVITGFLVSHIYLSKYSTTDPRLSRRLFLRGLKLVGIFVVLNAAIHLLLPGTSGISVTDWTRYLLGSTTDGRGAFSVLLPIGYLLMLSAGFVIASRVYKHIFHAACVVMLLSVFIASLYGIKNAYLELLSLGLLGVNIGYIPIERINSIVRHPYALVLVYGCYLWAITLWNELFLLQIVGVCLSLAIIYVLGARNDGPERFRRAVILLGQYSLLGYIAQIVILQVLRRGLQHVSVSGFSAGLALFAGLVLTLISVAAVDHARARAGVVNRLYSAVFA